MYAFYQDCDPLASGKISYGLQLMPLFVLQTMKGFPGLPGLIISGIFSGSLSTVSSAINSLAAVTLEDYIKPLVRCVGNESNSAQVAKHSPALLKALALIYGIICVALAFVAKVFGSTILTAALAIFGVVGGPLLGVFSLGMCVRFANQKGALCGLILSLAFCLVMAFGQPRPPIPKLPVSTANCTTFIQTPTAQSDPYDSYNFIYSISYAWYAMIGFIITMAVGTVVSLATGGLKQNIDSDLLMDALNGKERSCKEKDTSGFQTVDQSQEAD